VRVNNVDFLHFDELNETAKLSDKVEIIEAVKRIFMDLSDSQMIRFDAERAAILQTRQMHTAASARMQLTQKLHRLALASALLETIYDE
jgi:hypothetical protein